MKPQLAIILLATLSLGLLTTGWAAADETVDIRVDAGKGRIPISPYIYGKNHYAPDNKPMPARIVAEAGLRIIRDSNGNNCTKYNWKTDYSSHPDWYNSFCGLWDRVDCVPHRL